MPETAADRPAPSTSAPGRVVAAMAGALVGSEILRIAAEVRAMREGGATVCTLTVGDFDPAEFRIPRALEEGIVAAYRRGETNYPPSSGMPALRDAIRAWSEREYGIAVAADEVVVTAGSRPGIYGAYRTLVDPGDRVVYPMPSWNNNHYCHLVGAVGIPVACDAADDFLPTRATLAPHLRGARLLALNSPLNPAGTMFDADALGAIADLVLEENARRGAGERPLFLLWDQVYATLTFGREHVHPVAVRPSMAPFTVTIDGISKAMAATGVRVGWATGPAAIIAPMGDVLGHVGAWAPRAEQVATAAFLADAGAERAARAALVHGVRERLTLLHDGLSALAAGGHAVEALAPAGAIYLTARFAVAGRTTADGTRLRTSDDVRRWLLAAAGLAVVPFSAFGDDRDDGWFRLSVGAVSPAAIREMLPRLRTALESLTH